MHHIFYDGIRNFISDLNNLLWGFGTILLVFGAGIFFTIRIKGFNIIQIVHIFKSTLFRKKSEEEQGSGGISQFQALSTALAASMGTGNIVGVAAAISVGGAGAIFWMWVSALFGTSLAFAENVLGVKYKNLSRQKIPSPMSYISAGMGSRAFAVIYAAVCLFASFGIGNMTQTNAIASAASEIGISPIIAGAAAAILCGTIIFRGARKTAAAAEKIIPAISVLYFLAAIAVIIIFRNGIGEMLKTIFLSAFGLKQAAGGILGTAVKKAVSVGLRRGVFSNEAGMGSSVLVHTETDCTEPVQMGMWAVAEVIIDTIICCSLTAFVILLSGADSCGAEGLAMAAEGFRRGLGKYAADFVAVSAMIFAFCTLLGWYFYGEKCLLFISKEKNSRRNLFIFRTVYTAAAFIGAISELSLIWNTADIFNWLMLVINLFSILLLNREAVECTQEYKDEYLREKTRRGYFGHTREADNSAR